MPSNSELQETYLSQKPRDALCQVDTLSELLHNFTKNIENKLII